MELDSRLCPSEKTDKAKEFIPNDDVTVLLESNAIDNLERYSDEFYESYMDNFQQNTKKRLFYRFVKRAFDIVVSFFALILLLPLFLVIAIFIRCDSKGCAIFIHDRIGKDGKTFKMYKFRSMYESAPPSCATSVLQNPEQYYTRVGRVLRRTSLDELPQLYSVLIGKMSLVGYRPLVPDEKNCNQMRQRLGVFTMRPGITGYAQVHGRDDVYYKNKALLDAYYVKNASIGMDLKLLLQTVGVVLKRKGNQTDSKKEKEEKGNVKVQ